MNWKVLVFEYHNTDKTYKKKEFFCCCCCFNRDVKPENVILDEDGHAHLTDFNIATVLRDGEMAVSVSGTKPYMGRPFIVLFYL